MSVLVFRFIIIFIFSLTVVACGQDPDPEGQFEKASNECEGSALSQQFIVKNLDGSIKVVRAESENDFINGYLRENSKSIAFAEHDYSVVHTESAPIGISGTPQINNWGAIRTNADKLWAQNIRGNQVIVAVLDTGVDVNHPQLKDQIALNAGEYGVDAKGNRKESNGLDDDGNGFVDDYYGYNFVTHSGLTSDNSFHGTHVAGIIAAYHNDTVAKSTDHVQGVAPQAKILPLAFLDDQGSGSMSNAVLGIRYAVQRGARVINASWGGPSCSRSLREEIRALEVKKVAFVSAAGNEGENVDRYFSYPASLNLPAQLTVGAVGDHDNNWEHSNFGANSVYIFAPGENVVSTYPHGQIEKLSGTSMATPFVSGAVALLLSAVPDATVAQIKQALANSAHHNVEYINTSQGRLDLADAVSALHAIVGH